MKYRNALDDSPYRLGWLVWVRGTPGVVIIIVVLAILVTFVVRYLHNEIERLNMIVEPATQSAAQLTTTTAVKPAAQQQTSYQKPVASERPKSVRKHYSVKAKNEDTVTVATTQDEQEIVAKSDSSDDATGEALVTGPVVDYWSSVNKHTKVVENYMKAVEGQSKEIDRTLKEMKGGD